MSSEQQTTSPNLSAPWNTTLKIIIGVLMIVLLALAVYFFRVVFIPLVVGAILAYILAPVVGWLSKKMPRGLATAIVYLVLLSVISPLPAVAVPWLVKQVGNMQNELVDFISYLDTISADTVQILGFELVIGDIVDQVTSQLTEIVTSAAPASLELVFGAAETLLMVIFTFLIGFYLTKDSAKFIGWLDGLVPPQYRHDFERLRREIGSVWSAFLRGQVILALVAAAILTAICLIIGLPQPFLLGALGGLLEFLPSIGHAIFLVLASILGLVTGSSTLPVSNFVFLLIIVGTHTAWTQFDLNVLIPRIVGRQVHLHPMVVIIGIIVGAEVGGILGVALAAPTIATLRVLGRYIYAKLFDLDPFPDTKLKKKPTKNKSSKLLRFEPVLR